MTDGPDLDALAARFHVSLGMVVRRLRQVPVGGDLTLPDRVALSRLERGGPTTASELARSEQITPQAMGVTLARLEARGLVERQEDPTDGRRVVMSLTTAGQEALWDKRNAKTQRLASTFADTLTPDEIAALAAAIPLIERLAEEL